MKSISDVVGGAGLAVYAEISMVLFLIVFAAVSVRLLTSGRRQWDDVARLPLEDDSETQP